MRDRNHHRRTPRAAALTMACYAILLPGAVLGQEAEESACQLTGTPKTEVAVPLIEAARVAEDPAAATQGYQVALEALRNELNGSEPASFLIAAQAAIGLEDYEAGDAYLTRFVELAPECETPHAHNARYNAWVGLYNEGIQSYQAGETDQALESFNTANMIFPDARSYNNAALLYGERGDTQMAIENYRMAIAAPGEMDQHKNAMSGLASLLGAEGLQDEVLAIYEEFLADHPDDVEARVGFALALSDAGRTDEARSIFAEMLSQTDLSTMQWVQVGVGLFNSESYAEAIAAFRNARDGNPYNKEAMENYANASIQGGTAEEVISLADTLVSWYPYDQGSYQLLASALAKSGQDQDAMSVIQDSQVSPIIFHSIQMAHVGSDRYLVQGVVGGRESGAGQAMTIPFEFLDASGQVVAMDQLAIQIPAEGETDSFELSITSATPIAGFRYAKSGG